MYTIYSILLAERLDVSYVLPMLAVARQDIPWHDDHAAGSMISKLSDNIYNIEQGIGPKFAECIQQLSGFVSGIIIAYIINWRLALVATAVLPLVVTGFSSFGILGKHFFGKELAAYSKASAIAGEVISSIRTVVAFGGERKELRRYTEELTTAESVGIKKSIAFGGVVGLIGFAMYVSAALIFWYGIKLIIESQLDPGSVVLVFGNIIIGSIFLGTAFTNFPFIINAISAAKQIYGTIERIPPIDKDKTGVKLEQLNGNIIFRNVSFAYANRRDVPILQNFNLNLRAGQTVALVGSSGSGKSTIIHMIQRFYDPTEGEILVEGVDLRTLDLKHHRSQLGCVQQEPVLFEGTVADNIRMGKIDATDEEVIEAARLANAHDFIMNLPEAYETRVGESGLGLSGGQKQRIAIARAVVRQPKLLLLDEATSALDTRSERVVQQALDRASFGRTVLVVAHRLTTVRNADLIMVLDKGHIRETGTHEELLKRNGLYATMVHNQSQSKAAEDVEDDALHFEQSDINQLSFTDNASKSVNETAYGGKQTVEKWEQFKNTPTMRLIAINRPESMFIVFGCLFATLAALGQPVFGILYSEIYDILTVTDPKEKQARINKISTIMGAVGCAQLFIGVGQGYFFGVSGQRLIKRMRSRLFDAILHQEIGWFDEPENQAGALTAMLSTEASKVSQFTGTRLSSVLEAILIVAISLGVAFAYSWQITLVILAFLPFLAVSSLLQMKKFGGAKNEFQDSGAVKVAQEAIRANRTVTSFSLEKYFYDKFESSTFDYLRIQLRQSVFQSLVYALAMIIPALSFTSTFALGAYLFERGELEVVSLFRVFLVINFGSQAVGRTASAAPDAKQALEAVKKMLSLIDRVPKIILNCGDIPSTPFRGEVEFRHVHFRYPTRHKVRVLKDFSHSIEPGKKCALVGQSGCGKSTLIQLLQRFYDPSDHGPEVGVFFDGRNLRDLAPCWVRQQIGLVSQEPTLFNTSIRENIAYGDNTRTVSMDEIVEAARMANVHDFIASLPEGYETLAGEGGSQLSGGQKQRIAIARALIRHPVLLLLDEATSALDNESERLVQAALDVAVASRTAIVVAHRLTTVEKVDQIVVLENGRKIECGTPSELMAAKGAFYALHHAESS
ncbi:ATP-binding cassette, subfamily B (MDR/TAP), member 1 [Paragonimus westermani]|uniref:ATP-binding cassette, subfamily B (MDR/TAP), member 1 n=1 Tax=Paragonimus westermani TaxID=34504 RepID=A0A5J4NXX8_9TREM|nr:ATP-binding cassette, subfamily B (MDR/TAP), member 1 [Paragonimus westermani]